MDHQLIQPWMERVKWMVAKSSKMMVKSKARNSMTISSLKAKTTVNKRALMMISI